jgi:hypothetical protein
MEMESLNDLISMASALLDNGFDLQTFFEWKRMAFALVLGVLGPSHYYTLNFRRFAAASDLGLLAGRAILEATREQLSSAPEQSAHSYPATQENGSPALRPLDLSSRRNS